GLILVLFLIIPISSLALQPAFTYYHSLFSLSTHFFSFFPPLSLPLIHPLFTAPPPIFASLFPASLSLPLPSLLYNI
ncbi:MAG: hypothetical protein LBC69_01800, partial [Eubacteriaceae bacterium]|nr:hypothetical protein [Eubacteriaceae bacterium]